MNDTIKQISDLLNVLTDYQSQRTVAELERDELKRQAMPEEVRSALMDIDIEFANKTEAVDENIEQLKKQIKDLGEKLVTEAELLPNKGMTVNGENLSLQIRKGRVSWDDKGLYKYLSATDPKALLYRDEGKHSFAIAPRK